MPRIRPGPPCSVCGKPSHARNLCAVHHSRWLAHGHTENTRPPDWGKRRSHPLSGVWRATGRAKTSRVERWNDFWAFVEDVGERPTAESALRRVDASQPWGPENCYWKEPTSRVGKDREKHAEYQRKWRSENPIRAKSHYLKKHYGIGISDYDRMLEQQNGNCAICGEKDGTFGRLVVDHCHDSKKVRGLLCNQCNRAIGLLKDDTGIAMSLALYLERAKC